MIINEFVVIVTMLVGSAFFSGTETAALGLNALNIVRGKKQRLSFLYKRRELLLATCLVGNNITIVAATLGLNALLENLSSAGSTSAIAFTLQILVFFFLAEVLPKATFRKYDVLILSRLYYVILFFYYLFYPISYSFLFIMRVSTKLFPVSESSDREEVFHFVGSHFAPETESITKGLLGLSDTRVKEVMTPLPDVFALEKNRIVRDTIPILERTSYTRYPIYEERGDNIVGYVNVFDFLSAKPSKKLAHLMYTPVFVPETLAVDKTLYRMQNEALSMVFVVNEYGSVVGLVTQENIAEELVGDIRTEEQKEEVAYIARKDASLFELDGNLDIDNFNEEFNLNIVKDGFETVTGFLIKKLGRIPQENEEISLPEGHFKVLEADAKTIHRLEYNIQSDPEKQLD